MVPAGSHSICGNIQKHFEAGTVAPSLAPFPACLLCCFLQGGLSKRALAEGGDCEECSLRHASAPLHPLPEQEDLSGSHRCELPLQELPAKPREATEPPAARNFYVSQTFCLPRRPGALWVPVFESPGLTALQPCWSHCLAL